MFVKEKLDRKKVAISNKDFNRFFKRVNVKYKVFKRFTIVNYAFVIDRYFILGPALKSKI